MQSKFVILRKQANLVSPKRCILDEYQETSQTPFQSPTSSLFERSSVDGMELGSVINVSWDTLL
jgi:hypothetical protein